LRKMAGNLAAIPCVQHQHANCPGRPASPQMRTRGAVDLTRSALDLICSRGAVVAPCFV
jgi:hypothetical protein